MNKIVYLIEQPLDERNYDRFSIQTWTDRNWIVEVWDLTPLIYPRVWSDFLRSERSLRKFPGYFAIMSMSDLKSRYLQLGELEYFIDFTADSFLSLRVKMVLILKGAKRVTYASGGIPLPNAERESGLVAKLRRIIVKGPVRALNLACMMLVRKMLLPLTRPSLAIVSGENSARTVGAAEAILKVHSFDYDIYLKGGTKTGMVTRDYAVFIDQDACFHSDFIYLGRPYFVTPENYFPAICNGLKSIAANLNMEVQIAAHPRASYAQRGLDFYRDFSVNYGGTAELIKNCRVVVCHDSTAIHFAVLFEKPMIFVTTDELNRCYEGRSIAQVASEFGKSPVNLNGDLHGIDWCKEVYVAPEKYRLYKHKYIKMDGTPERPMWEVIIDHIEGTKTRKSIHPTERCESAGGGR